MSDKDHSRNLERVPTEIPGFDELCEGGLLRERTYLVSGTSGAGKTIFGLQYLYNGITKYGENGIYITAEETPEQAMENMEQFGWDLRGLVDEGKLAIIDARSTETDSSSNDICIDMGSNYMCSILDRIFNIQEDLNAKRAFICGATSIGFHFHVPSRIKTELTKLSKTLEVLGLTSLITCDIINESATDRFGVEAFVTDGTIMISYERMDKIRIRSIEIVRMKGSSHSHTIHPIEITSNGIIVHPNDEIYAF